MYIDVKYKIGEVVYLLTDTTGTPRVVLGYDVRSGSYIQYILNNVDGPELYCVEIEITKEKQFHL